MCGCFYLFLLRYSSSAAIVEEPDPGSIVPEQMSEIKAEEPSPQKQADSTVEEPQAVPAEETVEFSVSEEEYTRTFDSVETLIEELNGIIKAQDYGKWLTYLTQDYRDKFNNPEVLRQISEEPILKKYNIRLKNLHDYFTNVVVSSRQNARLDEIVFIDSTHIKAHMIIDNVPYLLYLLEKVDGEWKVGIW